MMTNECSTADLYKSMTFCPGASRLPGIRKRLFFICKDKIAAWPTKSGGKLTGNFTLVEDSYWKYMDIVERSSKHSAETQGEYPCKTVKQHGEFFYPGLEEDITEFTELAINDDLVYIVQESNGTFKVLGCQEYRTDTSFSSDTGQQATDSMGVTITAECDAPYDCLKYEGSIMISSTEDANEAA